MKNNIFIILILILNYIMFINKLHIYQLNYYKFNKQVNYIIRNYKKFIINVILNILIIIFYNKFISYILLIILIKYNFINKSKKKLIFTKKIIRYIIFLTLLNFIIIYSSSIKLIILLNIFIDLELFIIDIINKPINYLINLIYIKLAKNKLKQYKNLIVIAITGSYGKTSVKNYLYNLLNIKYNVCMTPKNYNTDLGIVKSIREKLNIRNKMFIVEMGATKVGDIDNICKIIKPSVSVITNIGSMHLESFKTIDNIIKTKFEIYENSDVIFVNLDDENIKNNINIFNNKKIISFSSKDDTCDYYLSDIYMNNEITKFKVNFKGKIFNFETKLLGKHNIYNLFISLVIADYFNIDISKLKREIYNMKNVEHRLNIKKYGNVTILDDSYNSNEIGSLNALNVLKSFDGYKIVVTPGMVEFGDKENEINYNFGKYILNSCDEVIFTNYNQTKFIYNALKDNNFNNIKYIENIKEVFDYVNKLNKEKIILLLENDLPDQYY